ncbi:VanZ family protein [Luteolibacter soli]|uniref:VanZ family protein n=1 Tax=Luteolibacter soli TaxID=3135280 RepID=A0ABU9AX95_9BACT
MRRLIRSPWFWLTAYAVWFGTLWWLSSQPNPLPAEFPFHVNDKLEHLGYFFGGGGLFSAFLFRLNPGKPDWKKIFWFTVLAAALVGAIDEHHQSYTPNRSAHDLGDFTADVLGAACGALVFRRVHRVLA